MIITGNGNLNVWNLLFQRYESWSLCGWNCFRVNAWNQPNSMTSQKIFSNFPDDCKTKFQCIEAKLFTIIYFFEKSLLFYCFFNFFSFFKFSLLLPKVFYCSSKNFIFNLVVIHISRLYLSIFFSFCRNFVVPESWFIDWVDQLLKNLNILNPTLRRNSSEYYSFSHEGCFLYIRLKSFFVDREPAF